MRALQNQVPQHDTRAPRRFDVIFTARVALLAVLALLAALGRGTRGEDLAERDIPSSVRQFKIKVHVSEKDQSGETSIIARPVLITTDDVPAAITIGNQVPVPGTHQLETVPTGIIGRFKVKWLGDGRVRLDVAFESRKAIQADLKNLMVAARSIRAVTEARIAKTNRYVVSKTEAGDPNLWVDVEIESILVDQSTHAADESSGVQTRAKEPNRLPTLVTRVYAVPDLVVSDDTRSRKVHHSIGLVSFTGKISFTQLQKAICEKVAPPTWESAGGSGRIKPHRATTSLVVLQTADVHRQVAAYLDRLRQR